MSNVTVNYIDADESWGIFNDAARRHLGIDGESFAEAWDRGDYADSDDTAVMRVAMLRPSGR